MKYNKPRGSLDFFDKNIEIYNFILKKFKIFAKLYNFKEIKTPSFEEKDIFIRSIGKSSDIVEKEMFYLFSKNRNKEYKLSLKPEGTASVIRAIIENKLLERSNFLLKLFYIDSMYRYERPQKGRLRQFHQFGVEYLSKKNYYIDAECIILAINFLKFLGIKNFKLHINSLGDLVSRQKYIKILKLILQSKTLCNDCKIRMNLNILRVLDCKKEKINDIPKIIDYINDEEKKYFKNILKILKLNKIDYVIDNKLVRGLDYYTSIVFEIYYNDSNWSKNTLVAGGRYDNLVANLEGKQCDAFGFAGGIERLMLVLKDAKNITNQLDVFIISLSKEAYNVSFTLSLLLRKNNIKTDLNKDFSKTLKQQFKLCDKYNSKYIVIIGDKEIVNKSVILKDNIKKNEKNISIDLISNFIKGELKNDKKI